MNAQDMMDLLATANLFPHLVDNKEWHRLDEVLTPDAVYDGSSTATGLILRGLEEMVRVWSRTPMSVHHFTNLIIVEESSDGSSATTVCKWIGIPDNLGLINGDYRDEWIKGPRGWRVVRRTSILRKPDVGAGRDPRYGFQVAREPGSE